MTPPKSNNVNIWGKKNACGLHLSLRKLNACKYNPNPRNIINLGRNDSQKSLRYIFKLQTIMKSISINRKKYIRHRIMSTSAKKTRLRPAPKAA